MSKAKEISARWEQIKPQIDEIIRLCYEVESHYEVTADAYQRGYEAGLNDAWEAARKICDMKWTKRNEVFGIDVYADIITLPVSECIEKIRQYEQRQEEQIQVGDEVELKCGVSPAIYMQGTNGSDEIYLLFNDGSCGVHSKSEIECKTGRHFPEIAEVLRKMGETNNG